MALLTELARSRSPILQIFAKDPQRCQTLSDAALSVARRLDDPATLAHVLIARYYAVANPATLDDRLANTAELLALVPAA